MAQSTQKAVVLLVDDDESLLELVEMALSQHEYEIVKATNGQDAITKVQEHRPSLVILDIMMPLMDGYEACRLIKGNKELADIPVIMLTAKGHKKDVEEAKRCGADGYVTKPFDFDQFLKTIGSYIP